MRIIQNRTSGQNGSLLRRVQVFSFVFPSVPRLSGLDMGFTECLQTSPPTFHMMLNSEVKYVVFTNIDLNFKKMFVVFARHQLLGISMVINTAQLVEMGSQKSLL